MLFVWLRSAAVAVVALFPAGVLWATPPNSGFKGVTLTKGTFAEFQVVDPVTDDSLLAGYNGNLWLALLKTQGASDVYVQSNTWQPATLTTAGGSTGWHTHPGPSLIIITSGEVTEYEDDCTPRVYGPGQPLGATLVDRGNGHVHVVRNEGSVVATGFAIQFVPSGAQRRIDEGAPENCQSIF